MFVFLVLFDIFSSFSRHFNYVRQVSTLLPVLAPQPITVHGRETLGAGHLIPGGGYVFFLKNNLFTKLVQKNLLCEV